MFVMRTALNIARVTGLNYEESEEAPSTYEEVIAEFQAAKTLNKPVRVYRGASENTIYTTPAANWAFRFWHDYVHFYWGLDFTKEAEIAVGRIQCAAVAAEFGLGSLEWRMMEQDTLGQVLYFAETGSFVDNQLEFIQERLAA
jgi:hypothetical protein